MIVLLCSRRTEGGRGATDEHRKRRSDKAIIRVRLSVCLDPRRSVFICGSADFWLLISVLCFSKRLVVPIVLRPVGGLQLIPAGAQRERIGEFEHAPAEDQHREGRAP